MLLRFSSTNIPPLWPVPSEKITMFRAMFFGGNEFRRFAVLSAKEPTLLSPVFLQFGLFRQLASCRSTHCHNEKTSSCRWSRLFLPTAQYAPKTHSEVCCVPFPEPKTTHRRL